MVASNKKLLDSSDNTSLNNSWIVAVIRKLTTAVEAVHAVLRLS